MKRYKIWIKKNHRRQTTDKKSLNNNVRKIINKMIYWMNHRLNRVNKQNKEMMKKMLKEFSKFSSKELKLMRMFKNKV